MSSNAQRDSTDLAGDSIAKVEAFLRSRLAASVKRPFVLGICGTQGSGKSTVAAGLAHRLARAGITSAILSLDDLYLPREDREALAAVHPLLRTRGVPGTHDVALGLSVIEACGRSGRVALPRFSKEEDTRKPRSEWDEIETPVDVILFEGWCVGAAPELAAALDQPINRLESEDDADGRWRHWVNDRLSKDYQDLFSRIDALILLKAPGFDVVARWRKEQEHALRERLEQEGRDTGGTMSDEQIDRFIRHYERITRHILAEMPNRADLVITLDELRRPTTLADTDGVPAL